ncbi:hypothetical protein ACN9M1_05965 [Ralstonia sp. R-29]|uniref:hypothetical protein n=1 Tax=Ralstonia sp. R-29 TaxID=3404059 RepID=UPI003CEA0F1A
MDQTFDGNAPPSLPDGFYIGLVCSPIVQGKVTLAVIFDNSTDTKVSVTWTDSHLYTVTVTDATGEDFDLAQLLPAPQPNQPPTDVDPRTQHNMVYPVDTSLAPYAGKFAFDPAKSPYTIRLILNSPSHPYTLSETVPVLSA